MGLRYIKSPFWMAIRTYDWFICTTWYIILFSDWLYHSAPLCQSKRLTESNGFFFFQIPQMLVGVNGGLLDGFTELLEYCLMQVFKRLLHVFLPLSFSCNCVYLYVVSKL